jgi:hypothetical protein
MRRRGRVGTEERTNDKIKEIQGKWTTDISNQKLYLI